MPDWSEWKNRTLVDREGLPIGTIDEVWPEEQTDRLVWAMVSTRVGHRPAYLPYAELAESTGKVVLSYSEDDVIGAPEIDLDSALTRAAAVSIAKHVMAVRPPGPGIGRPRPRPPKKPPGSASTGAVEREDVLV